MQSGQVDLEIPNVAVSLDEVRLILADKYHGLFILKNLVQPFNGLI